MKLQIQEPIMAESIVAGTETDVQADVRAEVKEVVEEIKEIFKELFPTKNVFRDGAQPSEILKFESETEIKLPDDVACYFELVNGQHYVNGLLAAFFNIWMLGLDEIRTSFKMELDFIHDNFECFDQGAIPKDAVRTTYCDNQIFLALANDNAGNSMGVDLNPGPNGKIGQVVMWGNDILLDEWPMIVLFDSWLDFLKHFLNDLKREDKFYTIRDDQFETEIPFYMEHLGYLAKRKYGASL